MVAVVTHEDVPDVRYGGMVQDRRLFAKERVRWEGDVVAGVAALTPKIAEQAAALIDVEYEPLPSIVDFETAARDQSALVHEEWDAYEGDASMAREGNVLGRSTIARGDVDAALAEPGVTVVSGRYVADSSQGVLIEPHAIVAQWTGDRVTVWTSSQTLFEARSGVAHTLQVPESRCGSSSRSSAASAPSATSTSRRTSPRSPVLRAGRSSSCSRAARSSSRSTTAARAW